jgi:hypothetical protein
MGYHIILYCKCRVKPEFIDFIKSDYFCDEYDNDDEYEDINDYKCDIYSDDDTPDKYNNIPIVYKDLFASWRETRIGRHFYKFDLSDNIFTFRIEKKPHRHNGDHLQDDYMRLMVNIIAPITEEILKCIIEHDDFGCEKYEYTDRYIRRYVVRSPLKKTADGAILFD